MRRGRGHGGAIRWGFEAGTENRVSFAPTIFVQPTGTLLRLSGKFQPGSFALKASPASRALVLKRIGINISFQTITNSDPALL